MNLFVGNLSPETTEVELRSLFSEFGEIASAKVIRDIATGISRGFGFVDISDKAGAFDAIDNLDGAYLLGNIISVKEAKQSNTARGGNTTNYNQGSRPQKPRIPRDGNFNRL